MQVRSGVHNSYGNDVDLNRHSNQFVFDHIWQAENYYCEYTCTLAQLASFQLDAPSPHGLLVNSTWISAQQTHVQYSHLNCVLNCLQGTNEFRKPVPWHHQVTSKLLLVCRYNLVDWHSCGVVCQQVCHLMCKYFGWRTQGNASCWSLALDLGIAGRRFVRR